MLEGLLLRLDLFRALPRGRADPVPENLLLRQQLVVPARPTRRPRLRPRDQLFWAAIRVGRRDWRRPPVLVRPETLVRWHRQAWKLGWRWRWQRTSVSGRPWPSAELRGLSIDRRLRPYSRPTLQEARCRRY